MIIDIHTHTFPTSDDSSLTPEHLIERAKSLGLDGVCITDHDGFWSPQDIAKLAKDHNFLVLPGCEVTTEEGTICWCMVWRGISSGCTVHHSLRTW